MFALTLDLVRARRIPLASVVAALLFVSIGYLALYPSFEDQIQTFAQDLPDAYKALIGNADIGSAEGYIRSQVYSLIAPLLIAGSAISAGVSVARAERDQTLATVVMNPLTRRSIAGAWALVVVLVSLAGALAVCVGVLIGGPLAGSAVGLDRIILATLPLLAFGVLMGTLALAISSFSGSPSLATGLAWFAIFLSFLANSLAELFDSVSWLAQISPWSWHGAGIAITGDFDVSSFVLLCAAALLAAVVAIVQFERRNLHL